MSNNDKHRKMCLRTAGGASHAHDHDTVAATQDNARKASEEGVETCDGATDSHKDIYGSIYLAPKAAPNNSAGVGEQKSKMRFFASMCAL
jgi:hypothetical protein